MYSEWWAMSRYILIIYYLFSIVYFLFKFYNDYTSDPPLHYYTQIHYTLEIHTMKSHKYIADV